MLWPVLPGPGRAQSVAPPDVVGRELVVGTKQAPPFATKDASGNWEGLSIDLWRHVADRLALRFRFQEETLDDLISKTARGELDAAIAAITVTAEREKQVDFSQPYYTSGLGIAVSLTDGGPFGFGIARSILTGSMARAMLVVVAALAFVGLTVWLLERRHNEHFGNHHRGLRASILWAAFTAAGDSGEAKPSTFAGQIIWLGWMLASVLVVSSFTAVITSSLTASKLQGRVQGMRDLRDVRTGTVQGSAPKAYLEREGIPAGEFPDLKAALQALESKRLDAVVYDRPLLVWTVRETFPTTLSVLEVIFDKSTYAIALPPASALRVPLNEELLRQQQSDWWQTALSRALGEN